MIMLHISRWVTSTPRNERSQKLWLITKKPINWHLKNAIVVSRAVNASIESHDLKLAKNWLTGRIRHQYKPAVDAGTERYLTLTGVTRSPRPWAIKFWRSCRQNPEAPVSWDTIYLPG